MKHLLYLTILLLAMAGPRQAGAADTVKLKDGTVLEGKILSQTDSAIRLEYNLSKGVKDIRTIPLADIAPDGIDKETPDEIAFAEIKELGNTPDLLDARGYDALISGRPAAFMEKFKDSPLRDDVQAIIDTLTAEKARVEAGGIKVGGAWINAEDASKDPYNHAALVLLAHLKADLERRDYASALGRFKEIEGDYAFSKAYLEALPIAKGAISDYSARLSVMERALPSLVSQREKNLKTMDIDDRRRTEEAFAKRIAMFHERREAAEESGATWLPVSEWDLDSITGALETAASEGERLGGVDPNTIRPATVLLAAAFTNFSAGKLSDAASKLVLATSAGAKGNAVKKLGENIRAAEKAAKEAAEAAANAAVADNTQDPEDPENPGDPEDPADPEAPAKTGTGGEEPPAKEPTKEPADGDATGPTPDPAQDAGDGTDRPEKKKKKDEGGIGLQQILLIVAGILVVVTLLAKIFVKPADDEDAG